MFTTYFSPAFYTRTYFPGGVTVAAPIGIVIAAVGAAGFAMVLGTASGITGNLASSGVSVSSVAGLGSPPVTSASGFASSDLAQAGLEADGLSAGGESGSLQVSGLSVRMGT